MDIKLYSTNCPKCLVLEKKLTQANIKFDLITDFDVKELRAKGFLSAPILKIDETYLDFTRANDWINEQGE